MEANYLDDTDPSTASSGLVFISHRNSITDDLFMCDRSTSDEDLMFPKLHTDVPPGSAYFFQTSYGKKVIE